MAIDLKPYGKKKEALLKAGMDKTLFKGNLQSKVRDVNAELKDCEQEFTQFDRERDKFVDTCLLYKDKVGKWAFTADMANKKKAEDTAEAFLDEIERCMRQAGETRTAAGLGSGEYEKLKVKCEYFGFAVKELKGDFKKLLGDMVTRAKAVESAKKQVAAATDPAIKQAIAYARAVDSWTAEQQDAANKGAGKAFRTEVLAVHKALVLVKEGAG